MTDTQPRTHHLADASPEFLAAVDEFMHTAEVLGHDHPQTQRTMKQAMRLAPRTLLDEFTKMSLLPKPDGYTEDGQPLFSQKAVATHFGITLEEARAHLDGMPTIDPARVHRIH